MASDVARAPVRALLRSLRWKVAALVTVACCTVAVAVGVLVHRATWEHSLGLGKGRAGQALDEALTGMARGDVPVLDTYDIIPPAEVPEEVRQQLRAGDRVVWYDDHRPGQEWMHAATAVDGQVLAVQVEMGSEVRRLRALDRDMLQAGLTALVVVVPLSVLATERSSRRLRRVTRTARRVADGDLDARVGAGGRGSDEIAEIATTVDTMAAALQRRLQTEQRFTADVAHELRTPLMGLVTSAELLPPGEAADLVMDRVRTLRTLVEELLEISRLDAGTEEAQRVPVPLGPFVEDAVRRTGLEARVSVTGAPVVAVTDPRRLDRILANLVVNAHRHGNPPVEVTVDGLTVVVRDHGPGFPEELLSDGPQRFRTAATERGRGHGLGLTIAAGQAQVTGAELTLANHPGGGAVATLRLPEQDEPPAQE
ncbi:HAMP domain-containing sensor histidine kinase [Streptomyces sp. AC627_RSS907]|uniref:sensor histidine kinase n=1 Tax=Streptomyces sp. AC627_RSS907 TaxID=2823684 RepID=UPI001C223EBE|nr:HAMP domain-containing sensor histidine kinase [Streptomyces sp. AC627_RSS907]